MSGLTRLIDASPESVRAELGGDLDHALNLAACFDRVELVRTLLAAGARVDDRGAAGITALESAIYHGSRAAADVLAAVELVPDAPWVAAGAGLVDRLARFLDGRGGLIPDAYRHRPNPADVGWLQRLPACDVPEDVLDEALVHAAQNERVGAVEWLLSERGGPERRPLPGLRRAASRRGLRRDRERQAARGRRRRRRPPQRLQRRQRGGVGPVRAGAGTSRRSGCHCRAGLPPRPWLPSCGVGSLSVKSQMPIGVRSERTMTVGGGVGLRA